MEQVAIIGAGELGGALTHALARSNLVRSVTLIDETRRVAAGKALDIGQAAPVEGFATQVSGGTEISLAARASIVMVADRVTGGEWQGEDGLALLKRLTQTVPSAVIVCVGPAQRELVDRGVRELKIPRTQLFGSAPESLAAAARALVALAVNGSPRDVALTMLGVPPEHVIIPWAEATFAGMALTRVLDEPSRRRLAARVDVLWPTAAYALAAAATSVVEAMSGRSRRVSSCFVAPETSLAGRLRTAALPVRLGAGGIVDVVSPSLNAVEQVALDNAMQV
jgi:malate dehydrogenase